MLLQFKFNPDKPFIIPFGEYPHEGKDAIQIVNATSAAAFASDLLAAKANGAPGLPIYQGHPDVPELAAKYPNKAAVGWITKTNTTSDSVELTPEWITQPKPGEFIYFSPYFFSDATTDNRKQIDELKSVALTNTPNDTRFRLPNEASSTGLTRQAPNNNKGETTMDIKLILEALGLPETASVDDAVAAIITLTGTANEETEDLQKEIEDKEAEIEAVKEEVEKVKEEFANERAARIGVMLDSALAAGRISAAARPNWEKRLGKRESFANESASLSREKPTIKVRSSFANVSLNDRDGYANEAVVLDRYESMTPGKDKSDYLGKHAETINKARVHRRNSGG